MVPNSYSCWEVYSSHFSLNSACTLRKLQRQSVTAVQEVASTVQYNTLQCRTVPFRSVQYSIVQYP